MLQSIILGSCQRWQIGITYSPPGRILCLAHTLSIGNAAARSCKVLSIFISHWLQEAGSVLTATLKSEPARYWNQTSKIPQLLNHIFFFKLKCGKTCQFLYLLLPTLRKKLQWPLIRHASYRGDNGCSVSQLFSAPPLCASHVLRNVYGLTLSSSSCSAPGPAVLEFLDQWRGILFLAPSLSVQPSCRRFLEKAPSHIKC